MIYQTSTITLSSSINNTTYNLYEIAKNLKIDDIILGLKYNNNKYSFFKGLYQNSLKTFNNQITLKVKYNDRIMNVKTFQNGSFQMTGCKKVEDGYFLTELLIEKFKNTYNNKEEIITKIENGLIIDNKNNIYNNSENFIGYYNNDNYVINNKNYIYIKEKEIFINVRRIKNQQEVLNKNGVIIGYISYNFIKNNKKFYSNNKGVLIDYINNKITYTKVGGLEKLLASIEYHELPRESFDKKEMKKITVKVSCINIHTEFCKLIDLSHDIVKINREKLKDTLLEKGYNAIYNPEIYSGLKFIYKYPIQKNKLTGKCNCCEKCTCRNISFLIFQSGKIIISNFKSIDEIDSVLSNFKEIITNLKNIL